LFNLLESTDTTD